MIKTADDIFPEELVLRTYEYFENFNEWVDLYDDYQNVQPSQGKVFDNSFEPISNEYIQYLDRKDFKRCIYNKFEPGDWPKPHIDSFSPSGVTYMIYLNPDWDVSLGGETIFIDNGEIIGSVVPKFGRLLMFSGEILHAARPPFKGKRYSLVFQSNPTSGNSLSTLSDII
jgi:Rps23 Pro-64 3,4-dihydroxylase Tpa1-like proline 4-hydroxylase